MTQKTCQQQRDNIWWREHLNGNGEEYIEFGPQMGPQMSPQMNGDGDSE